jgi:hypothetical protein
MQAWGQRHRPRPETTGITDYPIPVVGISLLQVTLKLTLEHNKVDWHHCLLKCLRAFFWAEEHSVILAKHLAQATLP